MKMYDPDNDPLIAEKMAMFANDNANPWQESHEADDKLLGKIVRIVAVGLATTGIAAGVLAGLNAIEEEHPPITAGDDQMRTIDPKCYETNMSLIQDPDTFDMLRVAEACQQQYEMGLDDEITAGDATTTTVSTTVAQTIRQD